ncbi:MAG TPA: helix-turn-helix transcriptional regulator [Solirubrobacteraceae bacterium]|nr:helix-turn-helix transcriptional regulator [Solirubrobacteraceae bacterium]
MAIASSPGRRDELRAFLRSRRARLTPADVGLTDDGARRRTPGLRREELAAIAGVGVSWYTWLEQGRDIHPSPDVLDALARALRLDAAERTTLFALARSELPLPDGSSRQDAAGGHEPLVSLVEGLHPTPAYLLGPMTRILAWNPAASALFGSPHHLVPERRSLLWMLLVDPGAARDNPGRKGTARNVVARFRSEYAQHAGEPAYERFVAELTDQSPWFAQWWGAHEVNDTQRGTKRIEHPTLGTLRLHHAQTVPTGAPDLRLTVYAPADAATRAALATLAAA